MSKKTKKAWNARADAFSAAVKGVLEDAKKLRLSDAFLKRAAEEWPKIYGQKAK